MPHVPPWSVSGLRRWAACLGLLLGCAVVAAAPADAGTVTASQHVLSYVAGFGEANEVSVTMNADESAWLLTERGAPLTAGAGCTTVNAQTASCPVSPSFEYVLQIWLRDGDDSATVRPSACLTDSNSAFCAARVRAGAGDDRVTGIGLCTNFSMLWGGEGADFLGADGQGELRGQRGRDILKAGACGSWLSGYTGADTLRGGTGQDFLQGGGGSDTIYGDPSGCLRGRTAIAGIDNLHGGPGDDLMFGCGRGDGFQGGEGNDRLRGGAGPDHLSAQGGRDDVRGGRGNDTFSSRDGEPDYVAGGRGFDRALADRLDTLTSIERLNTLQRLDARR